MSIRSSIVVSLLAWAVFLFFDSGSAQFLSSPVSPTSSPAAPNSPTPQIAKLPTGIHLDADAILDQASKVLVQSEWLSVEVRQRKVSGDRRWTCEGTLQRGPKGCCRLETTLRSGSTLQTRRLVVCDGKILARITRTSEVKPKIESWPLPKEPAAREVAFNAHGCVGPNGVLAMARAAATKWSIDAAAIDDRPTLAMTAAVTNVHAAKAVRLFLDAESLALVRAEWLSEIPDAGGVVLYDVEFHNLKINQPLSFDECARAFSYRGDF